MMLGMGFGSVFGLLALLLILWGVFTVFNTNRDQDRPFLADGTYNTDSDALEILKRRYAKGEISQTEYEKIKQNINAL